VSPAQRFDLWHDTMWELFGGLETTSAEATSFSGHMAYTSVGDAVLCRRSSSAYNLKRVKPFTKHGTDCVKLLLQIRGQTCLDQAGRFGTLLPGRWCLYDLSRPYDISHSSDTEVLLLTLPRLKLESNRYALSDIVVRTFQATEGMEKLTFDFAGRVFEEASGLNADPAMMTIDMIAQLVRMSILEMKGEAVYQTPANILRERVRSYINNSLRDPDLSVGRMANYLSCSKRYLHKIFEEENCSISELIWEERLTRCFRDLKNPRMLDRSISDIAFYWGFNSSAHFSTSFKKRFGVTARDCRLSVQGRDRVQ
jgi:AraC-like DNA-binding protein